MAKIGVIYTIGNSDIRLDNQQINSREKDFRKITESLSKMMGKYKFSIGKTETTNRAIEIKTPHKEYIVELPILNAFIWFIETEFQENHTAADYYFFVTDQADELKNKQDTIFLFDIFKNFLKSIGVNEEQIHSVKITDNPTDLTKMFELTESFIRKNEETIKNYDDIYIALGPGTPQMSNSILLNFSVFKNARFIYIPRQGTPKKISFPVKMLSKEIKTFVTRLIDNYEYQAALSIYKQLPYSEQKESKLLEAIALRTNFDFNAAYDAFNDYYNRVSKTDKFLNNLKSTIRKLKNGNDEELRKELYYEFCIRILSKHYLEAIGMVFRFEEEILKIGVEKLLDVKIEKEDNFKTFKDAVKKVPNLTNYLDKNKIHWDSSPNRTTYKSILEFFKKNDTNNEAWIEKIINFCKSTEEKRSGANMSLLDLRNQTPFAHGFEGVSEEKIRNVFGSPEVLPNKFKEILSLFGIEVEDINDSKFPFKEINDYLKEKLKE